MEGVLPLVRQVGSHHAAGAVAQEDAAPAVEPTALSRQAFSQPVQALLLASLALSQKDQIGEGLEPIGQPPRADRAAALLEGGQLAPTGPPGTSGQAAQVTLKRAPTDGNADLGH